MRVHSLRVVLLTVCVFSAVSIFAAPPEPAAAGEPAESYSLTLAKSAGSSIASSVGLAVAKELTGQFYDATCAKEVVKDTAEKYFCSALAGFSGRSEAEWKANLDRQLKEISGKLDKLDEAQQRMQFDLSQNHKEISNLLKQAAAEQIATQHEVNFDSLWTQYRRRFDKVDQDVTHDAMIKFAKKILAENLDKKLAAYNSVLTKSYRGNQALLRYPFFAYKTEYEFRSEFFNHDKKFQRIYDGAEEAFMDARAQQEKVVLMVLWAIKVLESDCQLKQPCEAPPFTSKEFMKEVDADTLDQLKAFNEGVDWLLLTYGYPHRNAWILPPDTMGFVTRANFLNAAVLASPGDGSAPIQMGMWGRVISMGDAWDGTINMQCGATGGTLKPRFSYVVNVDGRDKPKVLDWWISRAGNNVYDEVHFAPQWKVYHYAIPNAAQGPCTLSAALPGKGIIPYVQPGTEVMRVTTSAGKPAIAGSFIGIQRAGGSYAMGSGNQWRARKEPIKSDEGTTAVIEKKQDEWGIDPTGPFPKVGFLFAGRGEYKMRFTGGGGRVHKSNQIYLYSEKKIWFPEDREVTLHLSQGPACAKACSEAAGNSVFIVDYNIENGGTAEKEKGKLTSVVSLFLDHRVANIDSPTASKTLRDAAQGRGVYINGSYTSTSERKTQKVETLSKGSLTTDPSVGYQLQYLMDFDLETEGSGVGATEWMYRSKITPAFVYLTK